LFSYVNLEDRVPARHPLRLIREIVNAALVRLDGAFAGLYAAEGRPPIAQERLLGAALIQILFSVRSERQLEQMQYNLLFRWFVGLGIDDAVWVPTVFSKNRDRLLTADIVDGTLIQAWASMKSFHPKPAPAKAWRRRQAAPSRRLAARQALVRTAARLPLNRQSVMAKAQPGRRAGRRAGSERPQR
jgi:transposase